MKKSIKKLFALVTMLCLCAAMALPTFAASDSVQRAHPCPSCNRGAVVSHEERISTEMIQTVGCTHGHFGYSDAVYLDTWQTVQSCTVCDWSYRSGTYTTQRVVCLYDYVA